MHCWETMPNNAKEGPLEDEFVIASGSENVRRGQLVDKSGNVMRYFPVFRSSSHTIRCAVWPMGCRVASHAVPVKSLDPPSSSMFFIYFY